MTDSEKSTTTSITENDDEDIFLSNSNMEDVGRDPGRAKLDYVAGVIQRERVFAFERMLWRISRGNVLFKGVELDEPLEDPSTGHPIYKTIFVAFFQGDVLKNRIIKVCQGFKATLYPCPFSHYKREEMVKDIQTRLEDLNTVLNQSKDERRRILENISKKLPNWNIMVMKMKAIYYTLNLFEPHVVHDSLIGECWVPVKDMQNVQHALSDGSAAAGSFVTSFLSSMDTKEQPPTFNRTNIFTEGFQNLIDAFGMATYREVNPALYTIITFPFLFAVMFGDLGHGFILLLFALYMIWMEEKSNPKKMGEISKIFFSGRYIILVMSLFAMYTGFIYNDVFSISMNIFGSGWRVDYNTSNVITSRDLTLNPTVYARDKTYPFGVDPIWQLADNKIIFFNSLKMKLSIIFGVVHMLFGLFMSLVNDIQLRRPANIILVFVPEVLFLLLMFGYMSAMIFMKWILYSAKTDVEHLTPGCAPSILIMFINMVLFKSETPLPGCKEFMFEAQPLVQTVFVGVAFLCIPWLLFAKPIYILCTRKSVKDTEEVVKNTAERKKGHEPKEIESASEILILQAIHTIEYILSTVSHTASYLRLWALSLAHAELSAIIWRKILSVGLVLGSTFGYSGAILLFIVFGIWAGLTVGILVIIEGLSAFLHTLRLHWVEFMSKFYDGQGYAFTPFSFDKMLDNGDETKENTK